MTVGGLSGSKLGWQQITAWFQIVVHVIWKEKISNSSQVKHLEIPVLPSQGDRESHLKAWQGPYQGLDIPQKQLSNTESRESVHPTQWGPVWTVWRESNSSKETIRIFLEKLKDSVCRSSNNVSDPSHHPYVVSRCASQLPFTPH